MSIQTAVALQRSQDILEAAHTEVLAASRLDDVAQITRVKLERVCRELASLMLDVASHARLVQADTRRQQADDAREEKIADA